jgi:hypothetical protein
VDHRSPVTQLALASLIALASLMAFPADALAEDQPVPEAPETTPAKIADAPSDAPLVAPPANAGSGLVVPFARQINWGGYFDIEYIDAEGSVSKYDQHRLIFDVNGALRPGLTFQIELEFEHGSRVNKGANDGEIGVEQAWMNLSLGGGLSLRGGALLMPFGYTNLHHDSHIRDFSLRPQVSSVLVPTTWTESGVGFKGDINMGLANRLEYYAYAVQGLTSDIKLDKGVRDARKSLKADNNNNKAGVFRLAYVSGGGSDHDAGTSASSIAASWYRGEYSDDGATSRRSLTMFGIDGRWVSGPLAVTAEYVTVGTDGGLNPGSNPIPRDMGGFYVHVTYSFFPEFLRNGLFDNNGQWKQSAFALLFRYENVLIEDPVGSADNDKNHAVIGINWRPDPMFVIKLEFTHTDADGVQNLDGFVASIAVGF